MKKRIVRLTIMTAVSLSLLACGKGFEAATFKAEPMKPIDIKTRSVGDPTDPKAANAYSLDTGTVTKEPIIYTDQVNEVPSAYSEVKGRLQVSQFKFQFDEKTRDLVIMGDLNIGGLTEEKPMSFSMHGKMLPQKPTYMKITDEKSPLKSLLAAKVTCVTDDCKDFLVDFAYKVELEKVFYVVRVNNITPKLDMIEDFPTSEAKPPTQEALPPTKETSSPKKEASPKSEPVQGQEPTKTPAKSATAAPAPKTLKPVVTPKPKATSSTPKNKTAVLGKPSDVATWFKSQEKSAPKVDQTQKPSPQLNTGRIRKANEPKKEKKTKTKPIRKADPVAKKSAEKKPVILKPINPTPPQAKAPTITVEEETGATDEGVLEDSNDNAAQGSLAEADLKPVDIIAMFPELKDEKEKADKTLADKREKDGTTLPPVMNPSAFLKSLGGVKNLSPSVQEVLASLPPGLNQAVQVMGRNKVIQRRLQHGVNLAPLVSQLNPQSGLRILHPEQKNFWGTTELVATVLRIGQWVLDNVGNVQLDVADLSDQNGGVQVHKGTNIRTHWTHQHGIDVDLGYVFAKNNEVGHMRVPLLGSKDFLIDKQWELFKELFKENIAQQIYVSAPVKRALCQHLKQTHELQDPQIVQYSNRIAVASHHESHFHLRIKCGPGQTLCEPTKGDSASPCR